MDWRQFAKDLAGLLREQEAIDASCGVTAGIQFQNFHRGENLAVAVGRLLEKEGRLCGNSCYASGISPSFPVN